MRLLVICRPASCRIRVEVLILLYSRPEGLLYGVTDCEFLQPVEGTATQHVNLTTMRRRGSRSIERECRVPRFPSDQNSITDLLTDQTSVQISSAEETGFPAPGLLGTQDASRWLRTLKSPDCLTCRGKSALALARLSPAWNRRTSSSLWEHGRGQSRSPECELAE